jgi:hypothetical protein
MRIRLVGVLVFIVLCGSATAHAAAGPQGPPYYLSLGDSLAVGIQPLGTNGANIPTPQGYANYLYAQLHSGNPNLMLAQLGCSGETTVTMIKGGICSYSGAASQLEAAINFLENNQVVLVTLDIGADDLDQCISQTGINTACVESGLSSVGSNLPWILARLRAAAGPHTRIVAMNYYDPFLAAWLPPVNNKALALESLDVTTVFNGLLEAIYQSFGVPVADVAHAFRIYNFALVPGEDVPVNVFLEASLTWIAAPAPLGPNPHPNYSGYLDIAQAFASKIGAL